MTNKEKTIGVSFLAQQFKKKKSFLYDPNLEVDHHYTPTGNTWKGLG